MSASAPNDRPPSSADRPPVSRVGDELQQRADDGLNGNEDISTIERESMEEAKRKGWDKPLTDT